MEVAIETKTYLVHIQCEKCGKGYMLNETTEKGLQIALMPNPPQFTHKCNMCGHTENYRTNYPYTKLVPINEVLDDGK